MATTDRTNDPDRGLDRAALYAGALATEIAVIVLLWLFGRYFGV